MATKKKVPTIPTPDPTFTLTKEQFQVIKDAAEDLMEIRRQLDDLKGEGNLSIIMFEVGQSAHIANKVEDQLYELVNSFDEYECEECGDDNF